jgi:hypothetical protein
VAPSCYRFCGASSFLKKSEAPFSPLELQFKFFSKHIFFKRGITMPQSNVKLNSGANPNQQNSSNEGMLGNITNTVSDLASQGAEFVQNTVSDLSGRATELTGNLGNLTSRGSEMLESRLTSLEDGFNTIVREWDEEKTITAGAAGIAAIGLVLGSKVDKKWFALSALAGGLYAAHKYSNGAAIPAIKKMAGDLSSGLGLGNIGGGMGSSQMGGTRIHEAENLRPSDLGSLENRESSNMSSPGGANQGQSSMSNRGGMNNQTPSQRPQGNGGNSSSNRNPM